MYLYVSIFIFILLSLCSNYSTTTVKGSNHLFGIMAGFVFIFSTTVSYFDGVDWPAYAEFYKNIENYSYLRFEIGFSFLFYIFHHIGISFYAAIICYFSVISSLIFIFSSAAKANISLSFLFLFTTFYFDLFSDQIRQGFSLVLIYGFLVFLLKNRFRLSLWCALFAIFFHYSSIIMILISLGVYKVTLKPKIGYSWLCVYIFSFLFIFSTYFFSDQMEFIAVSLIDVFGESRTLNNFHQELINSNDDNFPIGYFAIIDFLLLIVSPIFIVRISRLENRCWLFIVLGVTIYSVIHLSFYKMPFMQRVSIYFLLYYMLAFLYLFNDKISIFIINERELFIKTFIAIIALLISLFSFQKGFDKDIRVILKENPSFFESR